MTTTKEKKLNKEITEEIWLTPEIVKALGGDKKWIHLGITTEKGIATYYLDGKKTDKFDWNKIK